MNPEEDLLFAEMYANFRERLLIESAYADDTQHLMNQCMRDMWRPWRWPRWLRTYRQIKQRNALTMVRTEKLLAELEDFDNMLDQSIEEVERWRRL